MPQNTEKLKYLKVLISTMKQISLTLPENLLKASKRYIEKYGYRNVQDLILEMLRDRVLAENIKRYLKIEERMKKGIGVTRVRAEEAEKYLDSL